jgi:hypothetical protein
MNIFYRDDHGDWQEIPQHLPYTSLPPTPIQVATIGRKSYSHTVDATHYPVSIVAPAMLLAYCVMFREVATLMMDQFMDAWLIRNTPFGYRFSDD